MVKWGKIGAPKSAKRKAHLAKIRKKRKGTTKRTSVKKRTKKRRKVTTTRGRRMARKKKNKSRRRSKRIPLSVITGNLVAVLAPPAPGWGTVKEKIEAGQLDQAFQSFVAAWTGLRIGGIGGQQNTEFPIAAILNPLDMGAAPALKTMLYTKLATKVARKLGGNPFTRVPILRDWVSFS